MTGQINYGIWYMVHIHMEYYMDIKTDEVMQFVPTWMDPESIMLIEVSQREKDRHRKISLICGM